MPLDHLKTLVAVWRAGSISKASTALGLTQPAVSGHIKALEVQLGKPLFHRHARGVEPTAVANELVRAIGGRLDDAEAAFERIRGRTSQLSGVVHFGGPAEFISAKMSPVFKGLLDSGIDLRVQLGGRDRLYQLFMAEEIEIGITASEPDNPALGFSPIFHERLMLVAAPDFDGKDLGAVPTAEALVDLPWLAYDETLPLIRPYMAQIYDAAPEIHASLVAPSLTLLRELVVEGAGLSVLPDYICAEALARGALVDLSVPGEVATNTLFLVWRKSQLRNPRIVFVRDFCLSALQAERSAIPS